ncbi:MAG: hypothetical protein JWM92_152 [Candidatus Nomurabacteria bacterium]|nr:hypothetical protein [Candidatus Nomurabacteria bacterium]
MKYLFPPKAFFIIIIIFFIRGLAAPMPAYAYDVPLYNTLHDITLDPTIIYQVDGDVTVFPSATLTIPAGTHLLFTEGSHLRVNGTLIVQGTPANHVVVTGGVPPPFIPVDVSQSPQVSAPSIDVPVPKHNGFLFGSGSTSRLSYIDVSNGTSCMIADHDSAAVVDHAAFTDCDIGIMGARGSLKLSDSSFSNVRMPAQWDFHGSFTHANTVFSGSSFKGWELGGGILSGETMKLDSTDGEYYIPTATVSKNGSLFIGAGVTVFIKDGEGVEVDGTLTAVGTADDPIIMYGDGVCPTHKPVMTFHQTDKVSMQYVRFRNTCSGMAGTQSNLTVSHIDFATVAGPAMEFSAQSILTANYITMTDVYQAFKVYDGGQFTTNHATLSGINTSGIAVEIHDQTPAAMSDIHITGAATCIAVSQNSSLTADTLTLNHCTTTGIASTNDAVSGPSGIILTNSEIENSGGALNFTDAIVTNISKNNFHDDGTGVVLKDMPKTILINNSWGNPSGPTIASNPGGTGTSITATTTTEVVYRPWTGMAAPPEHNPIIIVPGITGSFLSKGYGDKSQIWPNIAQMALSPTDGFLNALELLTGGTQSTVRPMVVGDIIRSVASTDVFQTMIDTLTKNGYTEGTNLFVLPYDWRLSNTITQSLLKNTIATALAKSGKTKVNIMAHSMGGLLVKDYLAENPDAPIDNLFYIGVPHLGAPKAFKTLMYGDNMGFQFSLGSALQVPILDPNRVKIISQNMPSVYELLPSQKYFDVIGSYISNMVQSPLPLVKDAIEKLMIDDGRNEKMFSFAQKLHDATDNLDGSKFSAYDFVGCGATKTISGFSLTQEESLTLTGLKLVPEHRLSYGAGDGVVPMNSANAGNGATNYYFTAGSHGTLPSVASVEKGIVDILNNVGISNDIGLSPTTASCNLSGEIVEVHSPVTLDIYDDQGRHTGPTASGDTEYGIPNVEYEMIGDEKFAFLPTGPTYTVINHAQAIGSYDMYISHSGNDDTINHETYFQAVPLASTNAIGTVIIAPNADDYTISMDNDGDGIADDIIKPSAVLTTTNQAKDATPPITTAVLNDDTVTLSASDENAGVLNTKYSIDTIHWNTYTNPFKIKAGTTVQFLSMDKAGNVENIRQLVVPAASTVETPAATTIPPTTPVVTTQTPAINYYTTNTTIITTPSTADISADTDTIDSLDDTPDITPDSSTVPPTDTDIPPDPSDSAITLPDTAPNTTDSIASSDGNTPADSILRQQDSTTQQGNALSNRLLASSPAVPIKNGLLVMMILIGCLIIALIIKTRF